MVVHEALLTVSKNDHDTEGEIDSIKDRFHKMRQLGGRKYAIRWLIWNMLFYIPDVVITLTKDWLTRLVMAIDPDTFSKWNSRDLDDQ